eukprot:9471015-Pyramimonas_sp.AAC.1
MQTANACFEPSQTRFEPMDRQRQAGREKPSPKAGVERPRDPCLKHQEATRCVCVDTRAPWRASS